MFSQIKAKLGVYIILIVILLMECKLTPIYNMWTIPIDPLLELQFSFEESVNFLLYSDYFLVLVI